MSGEVPTSGLAGIFAKNAAAKDVEGAIRLLALAQMETSLAIMAMAGGKQDDDAARADDAFQRAVKAFETAEAAIRKID